MADFEFDQSQIADAINRKYMGLSQRERNRKMAEAQQGGASQFQSNYSNEIQQAQQPTEFWGAGRKLGANQTPDLTAANLISPLSNLGGDYYYYGDVDPSKAQWGINGYKTSNRGKGQYDILGSTGQSIGTGYKSLSDTIKEYRQPTISISPTKVWEDAQLPANFAGGLSDLRNINYRSNPDYIEGSTGSPYQKEVTKYLLNDPLYADTILNSNTQRQYNTQAEAQAALQEHLQRGITGNAARDWETLGQLLNYGKINASTNSHSLGGNLKADPITGLQTLYNSTPLLLGDKLYGYKSDFGVDPVTGQWSDTSSKTGGGLFNKKKTTSWDVGNVGIGRQMVNPDWWGKNTVGIDANSPTTRYIANEVAAQNPGWLNRDYLNQNKGSTTQKLGFLGSVFNWLDPIMDTIDPMHNKIQEWTTGSKDTEGQAPYFRKIMPMILNQFFSGAGSALSAIDSASLGDTKGAIGNAAAAYLGASGGLDTGYGDLANSIATGAAQSAIGSLASGGDVGGTLSAALFGGLGGGVGQGIGQLTSGMGPAMSGFLSGAGQGAVSNLANPKNILESALSSGLTRGVGGFMNENVTDPQTRKSNMSTAKTVGDLAKLFYKAR